MIKAFSNKTGFTGAGTTLNRMIGLLNEHVNNNSAITPVVARSALAMESLNDDSRHALVTAGNNLGTSLEAILNELGLAQESYTQAQMEAAGIAGILAGDYRSFLGHKNVFPSVGTESMAVVNVSGGDMLSERSFGLEAYDERENRNAMIYSIAYNYQSARQDEFGETHFPTITLTPDNVGFGITVNLMMVYDGIERKISGTFADFNKKNIIRAVADPSILKKEQTRVTPIYRAQSADKFTTDIPSTNVVIEGETLPTAPLAFGKKIDLLGVSQSDLLLSTGTMTQVDTLDPAVNLTYVYAKVGTDLMKFSVQNLPMSNFTYSTQNNYRVQTLNFSTTSILLNKENKQLDGSALAALSGIVTNDLIVRLEMRVTGDVNIETGELNVYANKLAVHTVQDSTGQFLDLETAPAAAIVTALEAAKLTGFDLLAYRTNAALRQRGQFIDVTKFTQLYNVPLRSPITTLHPISTDGQTDASDVQALIAATRIRTSNEAVTALLAAANMLNDYVDARDETGVGPDILGVGRFFIRPTFYKETLDMNLMVDSIKSHERRQDIQAVLVNKIMDLGARMHRDSEYKAAADALCGGVAPVPVLVVGCDPVTASYLQITGDLRTAGSQFDIRIVSTLDYRIKGKLFITLGVFDENRNVAPNPLNFGNMIWAPELVLTANISRGGTISKETVVQPRYNFIVNCGIMAVLEVENIPAVLNKQPIFIKDVTPVVPAPTPAP